MEQRPYRRRVYVGTIVFYVIFFLFIAAFIIGVNYGNNALKDWLGEFEASQSNVKSQEVYDELFADPDWAKLYEMTNQLDTTYEGVDAYVTYMENLVGDKKLTMVKTSAGLVKNAEKYLVRVDGTKIADFFLVDKTPEGETIKVWEMENLNIYYTRTQGTTIVTVPGHTVYINGVALDESHVISTTTTLAEEKYLPEGLHGYRQQVMTISGLLVPPTVTITDGDTPKEVTYNPSTNTYTEVVTTETISQEFTDTAIGAAKAWGKYMINEMSRTSIQQYFDKNGEAYKTLPDSWQLFMQKNKGYRFNDPVVTDYYRYSDTLFSARVDLILTVTRTDNTVKDYEMSTTFFFEKKADGKWLVTTKTNELIQQTITRVKLTYTANGQIIHTEFVRNDTKVLTLPQDPTQPGKVFLGWYTKEVGENGKITMHLVFSPSETGTVNLSTILEPMELYAQFKEA